MAFTAFLFFSWFFFFLREQESPTIQLFRLLLQPFLVVVHLGSLSTVDCIALSTLAVLGLEANTSGKFIGLLPTDAAFFYCCFARIACCDLILIIPSCAALVRGVVALVRTRLCIISAILRLVPKPSCCLLLLFPY